MKPIARLGLAALAACLLAAPAPAAAAPGAACAWHDLYCAEIVTDYDGSPTLTARPPERTNAPRATFEFAGRAGARFECALLPPGEADVSVVEYAPCSSPKTYPSLADGTWNFRVRQLDDLGRASGATSWRWSVRASTPTPYAYVQWQEVTRSTEATLGYAGGDPGVGLPWGQTRQYPVSWECRLDDGPVEPCPQPYGTRHYSGLSEGRHAFTVRYASDHGNVSDWGRAEWTVDLTPPAPPSISGPDDPSYSSSGRFVFSGEPSATFEARLDGGEWEQTWHDWPVYFHELADGPHVLEARQTDQAGNVGPAAEFRWTVDQSIPGPPKIEPHGATYIGRPTNETSWTLIWTSPARQFECSLDGGAYSACGRQEEYDEEDRFRHDFDALGEGWHTFRVRAIANGKTGPPAAERLQIDLTPPAAAPTLVSAPPDPSPSTNLRFEFAQRQDEFVYCRLDSEEYNLCPASYTFVAPGRHTLRFRAGDVAGNIGPEGSHAWTVDDVAWATGSGGPPR